MVLIAKKLKKIDYFIEFKASYKMIWRWKARIP